MSQKIKTVSIIIIIILALSFILSPSVEARSGCCSHHGGVCSYRCPDGNGVGYYCCDGTALSAKCAPYYSKCSPVKPKPKYEPPATSNPPESSSKPLIESLEEKRIDIPLKADISETQSKDKSYSWIWWIIGIMAVGGIAYNYGKKRKKK